MIHDLLGIKQRLLELFKNYYQQRRFIHLFRSHLRPSDVFILGHPKSGNTWLAYMLAIIIGKDFEQRVTLSGIKDFVPYIHGNDRSIVQFEHLPNPRIFRNEWPLYPELYPKIIYLIRDPRAVVVSYFHHYRAVTGKDISLESFVQEYISFGCIRDFEPKLMRWDKQVGKFIGWSQCKTVLIVKYEDMVSNRRNALEKVLGFVEIQYDEGDIALAVERGSFEAMRAVEERYGSESYPGEIGKRGRFVREGKVQGWEGELPRDLAIQLSSEFSDAMEAMGYL